MDISGVAIGELAIAAKVVEKDAYIKLLKNINTPGADMISLRDSYTQAAGMCDLLEFLSHPSDTPRFSATRSVVREFLAMRKK